MRLHTDTIECPHLAHAEDVAGVTFDEITRRGSRSRDYAWNVKLFGSSSHRPNRGRTGNGPALGNAATWDQWGVFLGVLFGFDPRMIAGGPNGYVGAPDFHWQTGSRFHSPGTFDQWHRQHHFEDQGENITRRYDLSKCKCGAITRRLANGATRDVLGLGMPEKYDPAMAV